MIAQQLLSLLLALLLFVIASGVGQTLLQWFDALKPYPLERFVYATALGLGIIGYGVFFLGLAGFLYVHFVVAWLLVLAIVGLPGTILQSGELRRWLTTWRPVRTNNFSVDTIVIRFCLLSLGFIAIASAVLAMRPPSAMEWDVLAYHLADPKVFIANHRVAPLPTDHHSNFPMLMEMLYVIGLLFGGSTLANYFHWMTLLLLVLGIIAACSRHYEAPVGFIAALILATTPLIVWEATTAYVDIAGACYSTLAVLVLLPVLDNRLFAPRSCFQCCLLAGILMGFNLGIKYLGLIPFGLLGGLLLMRKALLRYALLYFIAALLVGSPWYIKNAILLHNPVYPFYFRLFPHSLYWSLAREKAYNSEQNRFGFPHALLRDPHEALINLLLAPWQLLVSVPRYFNGGEYNFGALIGGLYQAFCFPLLLVRRLPHTVKIVLLLGICQLVIWFFLAQIGRYLIQMMPLFAIGGGYGAWQLLRRSSRARLDILIKVVVALLIAGQVVYLLCGLTLFPYGGQSAVAFMQQTGLPASDLNVLQVLHVLSSKANEQKFLEDTIDVYNCEDWVNHHTKPQDGVLLYEEDRGYYLNRPYLWGDAEHSAYIPYSRFSNAAQLTSWFLMHGYHYAIINLNWSPMNTQHVPIPSDSALSLLFQWYTSPSDSLTYWRKLIGLAIGQHFWVPVYVSHGCVVLRLGNDH
ncbi:hypothetical protein [Chthonomonas calidirosea]|uniref:hypothetical protein n=1 Tax=Chthonomonas calidirosea TaxID=454171 RepID=UPI0006EC9DA1|nr:hypothetical protein [Chthonomonas calidirosea]CEK14089.1 hypothetical protein CP488_00721 [Chthonomonas calidirosea]